ITLRAGTDIGAGGNEIEIGTHTGLDVATTSFGGAAGDIDLVITDAGSNTLDNINAVNGNVDISSNAGIDLVVDSVSASGNVDLTANGAAQIIDNGDAGVDVTAGGTATFTAGTGIGAGGADIETDVNAIVANTGAGDIALDELDNADLTLGATDGNITIDAGGTISLQSGTVQSTAGGDITFNAATELTQANTTFDTTGNITFGGTLNGDIAGRDLTINNAANVAFNGAGGGVNDLGVVTVNASVTDADFNARVEADSFALDSNTVTMNNGGEIIATTGAVNVANNILTGTGGAATIQSGGDADVTIGGSITGGNTALTVSSENNLTLDTVNTTGAVTLAVDSDGDSVSSTLTANPINTNGSLTINGGADDDDVVDIASITTSNDTITFNNAIKFAQDITLDTGAGAGDVIFNDDVLGDIAGNVDLTIDTGTGDVFFGGIVG
ncbi:MAG: hypothetical protein MJA83_20375, partial [Gammaproteobacteria bacterium]|nr:hypothetical protein [Gammaproteobacteria bacterium]